MSKTAHTPKDGPSVLLDILLLCLGGAGLRFFLSLAMRSHAAGDSLAFWGSLAATVVAAVLVGRAFVRLWRRRDERPLYLAAAFLFVLLFKLGNNRSELSSLELPLAIFALAPAGLLVWALLRKIHQADELERRILSEALVFAFVVGFSAAIIYAFIEGLGANRPPSILWASLLVISWSVGLTISARRYQ